MPATAATATYQVNIAAPGDVVVGTPDLTLTIDDIAGVPVISGPSVDVLKARTTSHPFDLECIVDTVLFTAGGRLEVLGRLIEIERSLDGGACTAIATGRISRASEVDGRGKVTLQVSDERWVERNSQIFRSTTSVQLHPPGLADAWMTEPAAGTRNYDVAEVDGDAVRLQPADEQDAPSILHVPLSLRQALASDLVREPESSASNSAGNFTALRFEYSAADRTVISFKQSLTGAIGGSTSQLGVLNTLSPEGSGLMVNAWVYISGHSLSPGDQITGRFYFPGGVPVTEQLPQHIGGADGVHPMTLLQDVLDGTYGGQPERYDAAAMTAAQAQPFKPVWLRVIKSANRADWLERNLYPVYAVAPLVGTDLNLRPTALRLPQDLDPTSLPVLTSADTELPSWDHTSRDLVTVLALTSQVVEKRAPVAQIPDDWPLDSFDAFAVDQEVEHDNVATIGRVVHEVETELILARNRVNLLAQNDVVRELARELFDVFGDGPQRGWLRVPDTSGLEVGDLVLLDQDTLLGFNPDVAARSGDRLVVLIGFRELRAGHVTFGWLDQGPDDQPLAAPTVSVVQNSTDPDLVDVTISALPTGAQATVEVTAGTTEPASYDLVRPNVGNETVQFRLDATSGTAYARAYSTAANRIRSAYATDSVVLSTRARIDYATVVIRNYLADVTWDVPAGTGGMRTDYDVHARGEDPVFGSNIVDYDATDGGFTIPGLTPGDAVTVSLTPYPGYASPSVTGSAGAEIRVEEYFPQVNQPYPRRQFSFVVSGMETSFDALGEAVVSATGDEDADQVLITVGDGTDPADPTVAANDGVITGRTGTALTGVKVTTGNEAHVKARAVDAGGNLGPVTTARFIRRTEPFHKDTTQRSTSSTTFVTLETIAIPADSLGTDGVVRLEGFVDFDGTADTKRTRLTLGGTTIIDREHAAVNTFLEFQLLLMADGATNAQYATFRFLESDGTIAIGEQTLSEDSTTALDLDVDAIVNNGADAYNLEFTLAKFEGTN